LGINIIDLAACAIMAHSAAAIVGPDAAVSVWGVVEMRQLMVTD
jgi:hypothetical protein